MSRRYARGGIGRSLALAAALGAILVGSLAGTVRAASVEWGTPTAASHFGAAVEFEQPATLPADTSRVEVLVTLPGDAGPFVT